MSFALVAPRCMIVGGGAVAEIADLLGKFGLSRPLVVTDPFMVSSGLLRRCLDPLARRRHRSPRCSATPSPNPPTRWSRPASAFLRRGDYDCLIGFGGGSPIDTAKAMAILATGGEAAKMRDYKVPFAADHAALPVIAIPTTAGTGSECTRFTVITDAERDEKMLIAGLGALPLAAIVDYELTFSVPPRTTADTGVDSLTPRAGGLCVAAAPTRSATRQALSGDGADRRQPAHRLPRTGQRRGARGDDARRHQAGLAFSNASVALVHGMSRPIGAHFHVPHGLSNAMLLPAVTRFGLAAGQARYAEAARRIGFAASPDDAAAAEALADGLAALNAELGVPTPRAFGIDPQAWDGEDRPDGRAGARLRQPGQQSARAGQGRDRGALPGGLCGQRVRYKGKQGQGSALDPPRATRPLEPIT